MPDDADPDLNNRIQRLRVQRLWANKPSGPLIDGEQLVFHYALRCKCQQCGRLVTWEFDGESTRLAATCCQLRYTLVPRTVLVGVEPVAHDPFLPRMQGSSYSDPGTDLTSLSKGGKEPKETRSGPLSDEQKGLHFGTSGN